MRALSTKERIRFFVKVVIAHVITYIACGLISFHLFHYGDFVELLGFRPMAEISLTMILLGQITRGILFCFVIYWIEDSIVGKKLGWLKLWGILVILGIVNTYGPNMGSIEGLIYLDTSGYADIPVNGLMSLLEITIQPLLFSITVACRRKKKPEKQLQP